MDKITAKMVHSRDTIIRLSMTQYNCFEFKSKMVRFLLAMVLIIYGLYADPSMITPMIALFFGCILIANLSLRPRLRAAKVIEQLHGQFPVSDYVFHRTSFTDGSNGKAIPYSSLIRLVEDQEYIYLYISQESAYMVEKSGISCGAEALKDFLAEKTGLPWTRPASLLTFRFPSVFKRDEPFEGPRL